MFSTSRLDVLQLEVAVLLAVKHAFGLCQLYLHSLLSKRHVNNQHFCALSLEIEHQRRISMTSLYAD